FQAATVSVELPSRLGPSHCGQSAARAATPSSSRTSSALMPCIRFSRMRNDLKERQPISARRGAVLRRTGRSARRVIQEEVPGGIPPVGPRLVGERLEPGEVFLAEGVAGFLVRGVAVVDAAAERARLARGAEVALLERAEVRGHGGVEGRGAGEEDLGFEV